MRLHIRGAQKRKRPEYVKRVLDVDVLPIWKGRDARTIKPREVVELLDGIVQRGSRVMANRAARTSQNGQIRSVTPLKCLAVRCRWLPRPGM